MSLFSIYIVILYYTIMHMNDAYKTHKIVHILKKKQSNFYA